MKQLIIGLTGPTGSGKSYVSEVFKNKGFYVIEADKIAREIMTPPSKCLDEISKNFGDDIIKEDGTLDRRLLSIRAFSSKEKTELLNSITHPVIIERVCDLIAELQERGNSLILFDAPLLFESGCDKICDKTIAVCAPYEVRLDRIIKRDKLTKELAQARMSAQKPDEYYTTRSDFFIMNDSDIDSLLEKAEIISENLINGINKV